MSRSRTDATLLTLACLLVVGCGVSPPGAIVIVNDNTSMVVPVSPDVSSAADREPVEVALAREDARDTGAPVVASVSAEANSSDIRLLVESKTFAKDRKHKALRMTFDDIDLLKILNMDPVVPNAADYLPAWLKDMNGKQVVIRGWMYPPARPEGISKFLFTRDNGTCCFGPNAKIYDKIGVSLRKGESVRFIDQHPFDVTGMMKIDPYINPEGQLELLYLLEEAHVIE